MTQYTSKINTAHRLITKYGQPAKVRRYTDGSAPDPDKPWRPGDATMTEVDTVGVNIDFRPDQVEGYAYQRGDKICLIPAKGLEAWGPILDTDTIVIAGEEWAIIQPARVYPSNEDIVFQNYVRKWPRRSK